MSGVSWDSYNLPAIWEMIAGENSCTGADRVLGWDGLATAVRDQHKRLLAARDNLAAVWPPAKNDSAQTFIDQINGLADSMQQTLTRAEDTKVGLQGVLNALGEAQGTIRMLAEGRQAVSSDWVPHFVDHAEDEYDEKAQQAMRRAEAAVNDHATQIQAPDLFQMKPTVMDRGSRLQDPTGGSNGAAANGVAAPRLRAVPTAVPVSNHSSAMMPGASADDRIGAGTSRAATSYSASGPLLSGLESPVPPHSGVVSSPPSAGWGLVNSAPPASPIGSGGSLGGLGILPIGGASGSGVGVGALPGRAGPAGQRQAVSVPRALPSGAVIGGRSEPGFAGPAPMGGARGRAGRGSDEGPGGEADQLWEVQEGVTPVIQPDTTPVRNDPGPGVIGFGR